MTRGHWVVSLLWVALLLLAYALPSIHPVVFHGFQSGSPSYQNISDRGYIDFIAQSRPAPFSPERMPQPGSSCFHLNYEGPGGEDWDLEKVIRLASQKTDCLVVYWQYTDSAECVRQSENFFGLLLSYGFSQVFIRVANKMPGWYIDALLDGRYNDGYGWVRGKYGVPPGISGSHEMGYVPTEGDTIAGQLYLPGLLSCWQKAEVGGKPVAELFAERLWYIQFYNEVDFRHEWDPPFPNSFSDGEYPIFTGDYYLLGHWACSLTNGFSWLLYSPKVVQVNWIDGQKSYAYDVTHRRVPILIPPVGTGDSGLIRSYLHGCLDSFYKIPIHDFPVIGGYYSPFYGPGIVAYSMHAYAPCGAYGMDAAQKIFDDLETVRNILRNYSDKNRFESPVRVIITEFGCAQAGSSATRQQQYRLYNTVTSRVIGTPVAWWVFAGKTCSPPNAGTTGNNQPADWAKMAIVNYKGDLCDLDSLISREATGGK